MTFVNRIGSLTRKFARDRRGTVLVIFAMTLAPLLLLVGVGLDYDRMSKTDAQLKATVDAAVLAAQQQYALNHEVDYHSIVVNYVADNLKEGTKPLFLKSVRVDSVEISEELEMTAQISATVPLNFISLVGDQEATISARAAAKVGGAKLEVALVLDNTGSMKGSKIAALKQSAQDLVQLLMPDNLQNEKVKIALVPFAEYVRLDDDDRGEAGLDIPEDYTHTYTENVGNSCDGYSDCSCTGKGKKKVCTATITEDFSWYGCMGSRPHDLNTRDEDYGTQGVPGLMATSHNCNNVKTLQRLTDTRNEVINSIGNMNASGYTYIPSGLIWGWRALSPEAPFTEGAAYDDKEVKKVIVLMTDGDNTISTKKVTDNSAIHHEGDVYNHKGSNTGNADQVTAEVCANIKAKDIMLFTIAFDVDQGSGVHTLLSNCAGNGGRYFDAQDSEQLSDAFHKISLALNNLRLSQ